MKKIIFGLYVFIGVIISIPIILVLKVQKKEYKLYDIFLKRFFKSILFILNTKVKVNGKIDYPLGNTLVIANHLSLLDIVLLMSYVEQRMVFISKEENSKIPIISTWMKCNGVIFIPRENVRESIKRLSQSTNLMKNNTPVMIFPQGTRSKNIEFKAGSLKFVQKSKGDILPIAIKGTDKVLQNKLYTKDEIVLTFNEKVRYEDYKEENLVEVQRKIETKIKEQVN